MLLDFEEIKHRLNKSKWYGSGAWSDFLNIISDCEDKNLPKGGWIDMGGIIRYGCPFCHYAQERKSNFCPNCGADMRGGKEWT